MTLLIIEGNARSYFVIPIRHIIRAWHRLTVGIFNWCVRMYSSARGMRKMSFVIHNSVLYYNIKTWIYCTKERNNMQIKFGTEKYYGRYFDFIKHSLACTGTELL